MSHQRVTAKLAAEKAARKLLATSLDSSNESRVHPYARSVNVNTINTATPVKKVSALKEELNRAYSEVMANQNIYGNVPYASRGQQSRPKPSVQRYSSQVTTVNPKQMGRRKLTSTMSVIKVNQAAVPVVHEPVSVIECIEGTTPLSLPVLFDDPLAEALGGELPPSIVPTRVTVQRRPSPVAVIRKASPVMIVSDAPVSNKAKQMQSSIICVSNSAKDEAGPEQQEQFYDSAYQVCRSQKKRTSRVAHE